MVKPNAAGDRLGGSLEGGRGKAVPTCESVFGAQSRGDYSVVSRQPSGEGKATERMALKLSCLICVRMDVSI